MLKNLITFPVRTAPGVSLILKLLGVALTEVWFLNKGDYFRVRQIIPMQFQNSVIFSF